MSRLMDRAVRLTLALAVAGGLGFGARSAAADTNAGHCGYAPYTVCRTAAECDEPCKAYFGPEAEGYCTQGCCICAV